MLRTVLLFALTAVAEIVGCYLPYLWLREGKSPLLLITAALSLALFAWLLTLHPTAAGRVYAAYGAVYASVALVCVRVVVVVPLTFRDLDGELGCRVILGGLICGDEAFGSRMMRSRHRRQRLLNVRTWYAAYFAMSVLLDVLLDSGYACS